MGVRSQFKQINLTRSCPKQWSYAYRVPATHRMKYLCRYGTKWYPWLVASMRKKRCKTRHLWMSHACKSSKLNSPFQKRRHSNTFIFGNGLWRGRCSSILLFPFGYLLRPKHTHTHKYAHILAHTHTSTHTHKHIHTHTHAHTHTHMHTHSHTLTHAHTPQEDWDAVVAATIAHTRKHTTHLYRHRHTQTHTDTHTARECKAVDAATTTRTRVRVHTHTHTSTRTHTHTHTHE